jgi:hypothetical protein
MKNISEDDVRAAVREQYGTIARGAVGCCSPQAGCGPGPGASLALGYSAEDLASVPGREPTWGLDAVPPRPLRR